MQKTKTGNEKTGNDMRILDLVSRESRFSKFNEAIKAAGLTEKFSGPNQFTVFAPTNEAFAKLPQNQISNLLKPENREQLKKILLHHIVPGTVMADELKQSKDVKTEAGQEIKINVTPNSKEIRIANAKVMLPKEEAKNGFVYPVDTILQPAQTAVTSA